MKIWRMSMRAGSQGMEMWPKCYKLGIASITYEPVMHIDLRQYPKNEPKDLWAKLAPTQVGSLRRFVYEIGKKDIIYVKQGPLIVSKGVVAEPYRFNKTLDVVDNHGHRWCHYITVDWESDFPEIKVSLGGEQNTVLEINNERLKVLENALGKTREARRQQEVQEGAIYKSEASFRKRNQTLINIKKANSNGCCEVCNIRISDHYKGIKKECLVAHHMEPIGERKGASKTTLDDIVLLCPNCHAVAHTVNPPISVKELREMAKEGP